MSVQVDGGCNAARGAGLVALGLLAMVMALGLSAGSAKAASYQRPFKEVFGTAGQPIFTSRMLPAQSHNVTAPAREAGL
jgi:hypothetical protein